MALWNPEQINALAGSGQLVLVSPGAPDTIINAADMPLYWEQYPTMVVDTVNRLTGYADDISARLAEFGLPTGLFLTLDAYNQDPALHAAELSGATITWTPELIPELAERQEYIFVVPGQPDSVIPLAQLRESWSAEPELIFFPEVHLVGFLEDVTARLQQYGLSGGPLVDLETYNQDPAFYRSLLEGKATTPAPPAPSPQAAPVTQVAPAVSVQPVVSQPVSVQPVAVQPIVSQPVSVQPVAVQPELALNWSPDMIPELARAHEFVVLLPGQAGQRIHISEIPKYWAIYPNLTAALLNRLVAEPDELDAIFAQSGVPPEPITRSTNYTQDTEFMQELQAATQYRQAQLVQNQRAPGTTLGGYAQAVGVRQVPLVSTTLTQPIQVSQGKARTQAVTINQPGLITSVPGTKPASGGRGGRARTNIIKQLEDIYTGQHGAKRTDQNQIKLPNGALSASYLDVSDLEADGTGARFHPVPKTSMHSHKGPIQYIPLISKYPETLLYALSLLPEAWFAQTNGQPGMYIPGTRQDVVNVAASIFGVPPGPGAPLAPAPQGQVTQAVQPTQVNRVPVVVSGVAMGTGLVSGVTAAQAGQVLPVYGIKPASRGKATRTVSTGVQPVRVQAQTIQPVRPVSGGTVRAQAQVIQPVQPTQPVQPVRQVSVIQPAVQPVQPVQVIQPVRPVSGGTVRPQAQVIQPTVQPIPVQVVGQGIRPISGGTVRR